MSAEVEVDKPAKIFELLKARHQKLHDHAKAESNQWNNHSIDILYICLTELALVIQDWKGIKDEKTGEIRRDGYLMQCLLSENLIYLYHLEDPIFRKFLEEEQGGPEILKEYDDEWKKFIN